MCNRYVQDELTALRERRAEVDGNYRNDMSEVAQLSGIQVGMRGGHANLSAVDGHPFSSSGGGGQQSEPCALSHPLLLPFRRRSIG